MYRSLRRGVRQDDLIVDHLSPSEAGEPKFHVLESIERGTRPDVPLGEHRRALGQPSGEVARPIRPTAP
jgi:hypothetical protein